MPLNSEAPSSRSRHEFCLALKAARECNGITLAEIADATKIPASVFAALERNDLCRWPKGLYRRSFFRDYARTIGVPLAEACAEFVRWFPDDEGVEPTQRAEMANDAVQAKGVRLMLDGAWHGPRTSVRPRLWAALIDTGAALAAAAALAWVTGLDQPATTAMVVLVYFSLATVLVGDSPAKWAMSRRRPILRALARGVTAVVTVWRRGTGAIARAIGNDGGATPEPAAAPEVRRWVSDARRVGPASPSRLRVRIKFSQ